MLTFTMEFLKRVLVAMKATDPSGVDGTLLDAKIMLYTNSIALTPGIVLADLTEATFDGYARSASITWGTPYISEETGLYVLPGDLKTFTCTGDTVEEVIRGFGIVSADGTPVLLAAKNLEDTWSSVDGHSMGILARAGLSDQGPIPNPDPALD